MVRVVLMLKAAQRRESPPTPYPNAFFAPKVPRMWSHLVERRENIVGELKRRDENVQHTPHDCDSAAARDLSSNTRSRRKGRGISEHQDRNPEPKRRPHLFAPMVSDKRRYHSQLSL